MFTIQLIQSVDEFHNLQNQWNLLLSGRPRQTIFLTWEWLFTWWKQYCAGKSLWLITVWKENELVGAAPLMLQVERRLGMNFRVLRALSTPNCDESDFPVKGDDPEIIASICEYILDQKKHWDVLELAEFASDTVVSKKLLEQFQHAGLRISRTLEDHYYIPITGTWPEYEKTLGRNIRHDSQRRLKRVMETHHVTFQQVKGRNVISQHFETIFKINEMGRFPEKYRSEKDRTFHLELLEQTRDRQWVEISLLSLDEKPVAYKYGFNIDGRFESWRTGYDTHYANRGAGLILTTLMLKYFFENGYHEIDFLRGEHKHKERWQPAARRFMRLRAADPKRLLSLLAFFWAPQLRHVFKGFQGKTNKRK